MRTSDDTTKIMAALGKVQAEIDMVRRNKGVEVEGRTSSFASKYATIAVLYKACRDLLVRHEITIWQGGTYDEKGGERLLTALSHGGQTVVSSFPIKAREGAQNFGGGIAFARRWGLACAVGIFTEDDADEREGYERERAANRPAKPPKPAQAPAALADVLARMRGVKFREVDLFAGEVARARSMFPVGSEAAAVEKDVIGWFCAAFGDVKTVDGFTMLRDGLAKVQPKDTRAEIRAALTEAEKRVMGVQS